MGSPNANEAFFTQGQHEEDTFVHESFPIVACFVGRPQKHLIWNWQKLKLQISYTDGMSGHLLSNLISIKVQPDVKDEIQAFLPQQ